MQDLIQFLTHHWALSLAFVVVLAMLISVELRGTVQGIKQLLPQQVTERLNHHNALLIDLRAVDLYKQGHITSAVNIPRADIERRLKNFAKDKAQPVIVYSAQENQAIEAAVKIKQQGFTEVFNLKGGIAAWQNASLPLVK